MKAEFLYLQCPLCVNCWVSQMKCGEWTPDPKRLSVSEMRNAFGKAFEIVQMKEANVKIDFVVTSNAG